MSDVTKPPAVVVIGTGGMGIAIAKRIGAGRLLILADYSEQGLHYGAKQLKDDGHTVQTHKVDVSDRESVKKLATDAASAGRIEAVVHAAGLSPGMASSQRIFEVDLLGTAIVIDAFGDVIDPGGSLVCIASIAGHTFHGKLPADAEDHLAHATLETLLSHPILKLDDESTAHAYGLSKRANQLRVQAEADRYGLKRCRINSISPGSIQTPMLKVELEGPHGHVIRDLVEDSPAHRFGTPSDIASAVAFLIGSEASFITGTDITVDGGASASPRWPGKASDVKEEKGA